MYLLSQLTTMHAGRLTTVDAYMSAKLVDIWERPKNLYKDRYNLLDVLRRRLDVYKAGSVAMPSNFGLRN